MGPKRPGKGRVSRGAASSEPRGPERSGHGCPEAMDELAAPEFFSTSVPNRRKRRSHRSMAWERDSGPALLLRGEDGDRHATSVKVMKDGREPCRGKARSHLAHERENTLPPEVPDGRPPGQLRPPGSPVAAGKNLGLGRGNGGRGATGRPSRRRIRPSTSGPRRRPRPGRCRCGPRRRPPRTPSSPPCRRRWRPAPCGPPSRFPDRSRNR